MIEHIKKMWVDALRSGEYEPGHGFLLNVTSGKPKWCALGVLCDLAVKEDVYLVVRETEEGVVTYDSEHGVLPQAVAEWAGLDTTNPEVVCDKYTNGDECDHTTVWEIGEMNDSGFVWTVIAESIERSL